MRQLAMCLSLLYTLSLIFNLCVAVEQLRGVHPSDAPHYSGTTFACKDGSQTALPMSKVNDDYCDCVDSSDEPGTSACPSGSFFCHNLGHLSKVIFASTVNDGICDCCDGSDEYAGKVKCENNCFALGEETREEKRKEIEAFKRGMAIRNQYVQKAKSTREEKEKEVEQLKASLVPKQEILEQLQAQVGALEAKANAAKELLAKYKPADSKEQHEGEEAAEEEEEEEADQEEAEQEEEAEEEEEVPEETKDQASEVELLERTEDVREILEQAEKDVADLGELQKKINDAQHEVNEIKLDISTHEDYLKVDIGDDAFQGIRDQTFELHTHQYTYKFTPFKEVKQHSTRLGIWGKWIDEGHTQMEYSGGERCWNGPDRKTIVNLSCGDTNEVLSVQEPNKCEYLMEFVTPAACSAERLRVLEEGLANLENPNAEYFPFNVKDIF